MPKVLTIYETANAKKYLESRQLISLYQKAKKILLSGDTKRVNFKLRKPKQDEIYEFYIDKKFRAFGRFEETDFLVFKISDHQKQ